MDSALFIGWGATAAGRERRSVELFGQSLKYLTNLVVEGRVFSVEPFFLEPHLGQLRGEQSPMFLLDLGRLVLAQLAPRLACQTLRQQSTAHPDAPMDAPDGQVDATQLERLVPGDGVLVDAVGEGAVEVEQQGRAVGHDRN